MRRNKTHETTHKTDDYQTRAHSHTRPRKRTIIALGLLRELGQVDITFSFLLCSHCRLFLLARCDADPRKNAETHTGSQEAVNSSPTTMYKQRRRRTRNEESATQSAKWPAAELGAPSVCALQLLPPCHPATPTASPPCHPETLPPYHPATLPPPSLCKNQRRHAAVFPTWLRLISEIS
jgi:hypothetical protein